jgi:uncharacterized protein (TIGR02646 family)
LILIRKGQPPRALVTYRRQVDRTTEPPRPARYDGPGFEAVKPAVREALVASQRGVCCYCTDRIHDAPDRMKIEHRTPQRGPQAAPERDLDWTNLFGACVGVIANPAGRGPMTLHCDAAKGESLIAIDPTDPEHIGALSYLRNGRLLSSRLDHQRDIDDTLNLNAAPLCERRTRALGALQAELNRRYGARSLPADKLRKLLAHHRDPPGDHSPFAGFLSWWLERAVQKVAGPG